MRKKIDVQDLAVGMYVVELDRPWTGTPFLFQGFAIDSENTLRQLRETCNYVYIDLAKKSGDAAIKHAPSPLILQSSQEETRHRQATTVDRILAELRIQKPRRPDKRTLEEELGYAKETLVKATETIFTTLEDVRMGRSVNTTEAKQAVADMVESVLHNPDALVVLSQLKDADAYTAEHSLRVCILALTFGRHLDFSSEELNLLGVGALLHDVGKMKVPADILNKTGQLTTKEFEIMKNHVPLGVQILENSPGIARLSIEVAERHHERYAGDGYTIGLSGDNIGTFGLLAGIVDCYDAITSDRAYHEGTTAYDALSKLYQWRSEAFHPRLVEQFIQCMGVYPIGSVVEMTTGAIGVVMTVNRDRRLKPCVALALNEDKQPYEATKIVDLMEESSRHPSTVLDIKKVLPSGAHGINPTDYLSLAMAS